MINPHIKNLFGFVGTNEIRPKSSAFIRCLTHLAKFFLCKSQWDGHTNKKHPDWISFAMFQIHRIYLNDAASALISCRE